VVIRNLLKRIGLVSDTRPRQTTCVLCSAAFKYTNAQECWSLVMKTSEGEHSVSVCDPCAETLQSIKDGVDG
jgi:uncharacterized protein with PIN domain